MIGNIGKQPAETAAPSKKKRHLKKYGRKLNQIFCRKYFMVVFDAAALLIQEAQIKSAEGDWKAFVFRKYNASHKQFASEVIMYDPKLQ